MAISETKRRSKGPRERERDGKVRGVAYDDSFGYGPFATPVHVVEGLACLGEIVSIIQVIEPLENHQLDLSRKFQYELCHSSWNRLNERRLGYSLAHLNN